MQTWLGSTKSGSKVGTFLRGGMRFTREPSSPSGNPAGRRSIETQIYEEEAEFGICRRSGMPVLVDVVRDVVVEAGGWS